MNSPSVVVTNHNALSGHLFALVTILIWGTTFVSTKLLLADFSPVEILFTRFVLGLLALWIVYPRRFGLQSWKREITFAVAGLCGVTLYYLLENIALTLSSASNVGVIISLAPFFTALFAYFFLRDERPRLPFYVGFVLAIVGIALISFNGSTTFALNPLGDVLAVLASIVWALYAVLSRKIGSYDVHPIQSTRRIFTYGLVFMLPALSRFEFDLARFVVPSNMFNLLFLGLGASALCFVTWNSAVQRLGAVRTSVYIYMVPVITVGFSILILHETLSWVSGFGIILTLTGLLISK
ncbi:MAG: DMT family transporter [Bacilli bacterium]